MKRTLVIAMTLGICMAGAGRAEADWWGFFEQFSGPGPFAGRVPGSSLHQMLCDPAGSRALGSGLQGLRAGTPSGSSSRLQWCLWFDMRNLHASADARGFPAIQLSTFDGGLAYSWRGLVTFGGGPGVLRLTADLPGSDTKTTLRFITSARFTLAPLRLAWLRQLATKPDESLGFGYKVAGAVKFYYKPTFTFGSLSGSDFGVPGVACPDCGNEGSSSYGMSIDVLEFIR